MNGTTRFFCNTGLSAVRVAGADATAFLNAQCTAALVESADTVQFAALADPKGRVRLVFHAWRADDAWLLSVAAGEAEGLCGHLARFVFRSRVRIEPASKRRLLGLVGPQANAAFAAIGTQAPAQNRLVHANGLTIAGLAGERWLIAGDEAALAETAQGASIQTFADWKRARMLANEVEIRTETRGRFLPQMLGLVELDAVNFRKGCYPGQEVIARATHRGRVKRALALLTLDTALEPGTSREIEGARFEVLDSVALADDRALVQAVAPSPLPPALRSLLA
jgi:folate-binding protein YgfZ